MKNLKKLLLAGLLAISFSPVLTTLMPTALAACPPTATSTSCTVWCPGTAADPRTGTSNPDPNVANQRQYTYTYSAVQIDSTAANCPLSSASDFISTLGRIFTAGAAILAVISGLFILSAAFMYVTSHGDEEKVGTAKNVIVYAIMGLVLAGLAYGIPLVVRGLVF